MPSSDHHDQRKRRNDEHTGSASKAKASGKRASTSEKGSRRATPLALDDQPNGILSPILSHLPSLTPLKSFLPSSPPPARKSKPTEVDNGITSSIWHDADLEDGKGKRPLLLVTSREIPLQIWSVHDSHLPEDPHVQESYESPEQVFCLTELKYTEGTERSSLVGQSSESIGNGKEYALCARLLIGPIWKTHGPVIAILTMTPGKRKSSPGMIALIICTLRDRNVIKRVEIGQGTAASLEISGRAIVITATHPSPRIQILDTSTLEPLRSALEDLPTSSFTTLPVMALSGRLLAFATNEAPRNPGPDGLGTIITAKSSSRLTRRPSSSLNARPESSAILASAVELGGTAARGVWAGLKMGAKAAGAGSTRAGRLARSAPAEGSILLNDEEEISEARSMDDSSILDEPPRDTKQTGGGEWIKILDLVKGSVIAHFQLPRRPFLPGSPQRPDRPSTATSQAVTALSFSPDGTRLIAASDGRISHLFHIHPAPFDSPSSTRDVLGEVWHIYELHRGNTSAEICGISWDKAGRWVGLVTGKGTVHVFAIHPSGSSPTIASHASLKPFNPISHTPLSIPLTPVARLRKPDNPESDLSPCSVTFSRFRSDPLNKRSFVQDVQVVRGDTIELARLVTSPKVQDQQVIKGSGLTEMMRTASQANGGLAVKSSLRARWLIPDDLPDLYLSSGGEPLKSIRLNSLAQAEIQTFSLVSRILPGSIYQSKQVEFFAAKAIDEYNTLSIMDLEARTRKIEYRDQVTAKPIESQSFDEPLLSALHSVIESPPDPQIPGLPNGHPSRKWVSAIPIRSVAAGLGEGVDRVKREYVRAQYMRTKRNNQAISNGTPLSFEDDAVFASTPEEDEGVESSPPSSGTLPPENNHSREDGIGNRGDEEEEEDLEWQEKWEEEYNKAVEDDGGPDDLVLGLLDEEQEERKKWELRQKSIAKQYMR